MKRKNVIVMLSAAMLGTVVLSGCGGGSAYKKADKTTGSIDALRAELLSSKKQIDKMMSALNEVVAMANTDPRPAYESFKKEFANTNKQAEKVRKRADDIRKQGQAYFKKWEAQFEKVSSPQMKQQFEQRKAEMAAKYQKIQQYSELVDADYKAFVRDIGDIQVVLGVDLTAKGIKSVSDTVTHATQQAQTIYEHINTYVSILNEVSVAMSPSGK